jgi:OHCU decarboxylase
MRNPEAVAAMKEAGWEIASHGLRWLEYKDFRGDERRHIAECVRLHTEITGERPLGIYQGKPSDNTLRLVMEEGGFVYSADSYADELPYWVEGERPASDRALHARRQRHALCHPAGLQFRRPVLRLSEGQFRCAAGGRRALAAPKMLSVGLHCRLVGVPGRAAALARFLDYVAVHEKAWVARRIDIANHWHAHHHPEADMIERDEFVRLYGGVFEHSPWIAERAYDHGRVAAPLKAGKRSMRRSAPSSAPPAMEERLGVLRAHPDLAGKLAIAGELTAESTAEQAGAGLDRLSADEHARFTELNARYMRDFGFPFIIAVKGLGKDDILKAFEARVANDAKTEFETACAQVERIAGLRIAALVAGELA